MLLMPYPTDNCLHSLSWQYQRSWRVNKHQFEKQKKRSVLTAWMFHSAHVFNPVVSTLPRKLRLCCCQLKLQNWVGSLYNVDIQTTLRHARGCQVATTGPLKIPKQFVPILIKSNLYQQKEETGTLKWYLSNHSSMSQSYHMENSLYASNQVCVEASYGSVNYDLASRGMTEAW